MQIRNKNRNNAKKIRNKNILKNSKLDTPLYRFIGNICTVFISVVVSIFSAISVSNSNYKNNLTTSIVSYKMNKLQDLTKNIGEYTTLILSENTSNIDLKEFGIKDKDGKKIVDLSKLSNLNSESIQEIEDKSNKISILKNKILFSLDLSNNNYKSLYSEINTSNHYLRDAEDARTFGFEEYSWEDEIFLSADGKAKLTKDILSTFTKYEKVEIYNINKSIK